ncbi:hypothetical protein THTE_3456 [Thermogutta terrifontis]|uniref:RHS repeat-associated core domain-containing protein n=1 Tax=Thermogutta terrifontis TaxID=1331910 RepID=A0A286RJC5_9BACT|nr:hypothetical protein THTE_3456 [Thermogutta terrifontis]
MIEPLRESLGHVRSTLTDHVEYRAGHCDLRPADGFRRGRKTRQPRCGGGKGATIVVNHLIYDAFGRVTSETNPTKEGALLFEVGPLLVRNSLFLFTARSCDSDPQLQRPFDSDTQLQNNLNRWYDASVGRWLSEDPIGFAGGDGNLYRYVENTAHTEKDPNGLWPYFKPKTYGDCIKDVEVTYQGCRKRAAVVCELYARLVSGGGLGNEPIRRQIFLTCVLAYDFACQADRNLGWYLCRRWFCET